VVLLSEQTRTTSGPVFPAFRLPSLPEVWQAARRLCTAENLGTLCGVLGARACSSGAFLEANLFFALANPIIGAIAWKNGGRSIVLLYGIFEYYALRGILQASGVLV